MRKLMAAEIVSIDGVVESPDDWTPRYFEPEVGQVIGQALQAADALLLGRRTYEEFAAVWPQRGTANPVGAFMNNTRKYVVSKTLDVLGWNNSFRIDDVVKGVTQLKKRDGRNINVTGSATLVRSLLRHELLDELQLFIYPVVRGTGKRLFQEEGTAPTTLHLETVRRFDTGLVHLTYTRGGSAR